MEFQRIRHLQQFTNRYKFRDVKDGSDSPHERPLYILTAEKQTFR